MRLLFTISLLMAMSLSYTQIALENIPLDASNAENTTASTTNNYDTSNAEESDTEESARDKQEAINKAAPVPAAVLEFYQNPALPLGAVQAAPNVYSDVSRNHWAAQAIARMTQLGIITGYPDGTFQGQNSISRYESAVLTARLYEFVIDYAEQLYLYTNQDVQTLQEIIRLQQAQIKSQNEEIITLNEQLQNQAATQNQTVQDLSQLQQRVNTVDSKVTQSLSPNESAAMLEQLEQLNTDQQVNADYLRQLEQQVQQLEQQLRILEPAHLASDSNTSPEDTSNLDGTSPYDTNDNVDFSDDGGYNGTAIAITPTDGQRPEKGVSIAPARANPFYVGISPLGVNTYSGFTLGLRVGYDHLEGPVGIVGKLNYAVGAGLFTASVSALIPITTPMENLDIYAGLGLGINTNAQVTGLMLELPLGVEYFLNDEMSFFAEISPDYRFGVHAASVSLSAGINFRF